MNRKTTCMNTIVSAALVLLLVACSAMSRQGGEGALFAGEESGPEHSLNSEVSPEEKGMPLLYQDLFLGQLKNVGNITYEQFLAAMDEKDYRIGSAEEIPFREFAATIGKDEHEFATVIPDDLIKITASHVAASDMSATLYFYPNFQYQYVLTRLTYGNFNYFVTASDTFHSTELVYETYAINGEAGTRPVSSVAKLSQFLFEEVPELYAAYQQSLEGLEELEVELSIETAANEEGQTLVFLYTNLPDNTQVELVLLSEGSPAHRQVAIVHDGTVTAGQFRNSDMVPLHGAYTLAISTPPAREQSQSVRERIGPNGELLTGGYVGKSGIDGSNVVSASFLLQL